MYNASTVKVRNKEIHATEQKKNGLARTNKYAEIMHKSFYVGRAFYFLKKIVLP